MTAPGEFTAEQQAEFAEALRNQVARLEFISSLPQPARTYAYLAWLHQMELGFLHMRASTARPSAEPSLLLAAHGERH